ncbi:hypothetical protein D3C78_1952520 [compost metagenome]
MAVAMVIAVPAATMLSPKNLYVRYESPADGKARVSVVLVTTKAIFLMLKPAILARQ